MTATLASADSRAAIVDAAVELADADDRYPSSPSSVIESYLERANEYQIGVFFGHVFEGGLNVKKVEYFDLDPGDRLWWIFREFENDFLAKALEEFRGCSGFEARANYIAGACLFFPVPWERLLDAAVSDLTSREVSGAFRSLQRGLFNSCNIYLNRKFTVDGKRAALKQAFQKAVLRRNKLRLGLPPPEWPELAVVPDRNYKRSA